MKVQRIAEADVEQARQSKLLADANRQPAAVDENRRPRPLRRDTEESLHAIVVQGVAVHRREETYRAQAVAID